MLKKVLLLTLCLLFCAMAHAGIKNEITMLIVPRDAKAIQIAQDIADAYPVLLVVYRQTGSVLDLHAWNGENWVAVSVEDYTNGVFFANAPTHAILIQPGRVSVPDALVPPGVWCQSGSRLLSTDPRVLIHLLGRHFNFPYRHWKQLADRYGYTLEQVNPALINVYWWHYRGDVVRNKLAQRDSEADLDQWYALEITPPPAPPAEEPLVDEKAEEEPAATEPAKEVEKPAEESVAADVSAETSVKAEEATEAPPAAAEPIEEIKAEQPVAEKPPVTDEEMTPAPVEEAADLSAEAKEPAPTAETVKEVPVAPAEPPPPPPLPAAKEKSASEADPFLDKEIPAAQVLPPKKSN